MVSFESWRAPSHRQAGQASLLLIGVVGALLAGLLVLFAFGEALGPRGATSGARPGGDLGGAGDAPSYSRLFEPPLLPNGAPDRRHLSNAAYLALARQVPRRRRARNCDGCRSPTVSSSWSIPRPSVETERRRRSPVGEAPEPFGRGSRGRWAGCQPGGPGRSLAGS